jgi:polygalacturonase
MHQFKTLLALLLISNIVFAQVYDITKFGAKGDAKFLNTNQIQKAINKASANGGGTVWIPAGTFLTGEIEVKSNISLHLDNGAMLLGSPDMKDYPTFKHLIYGNNLKNFSIEGKGTINGNGLSFFDKDFKVKTTRPEPFIVLENGENITVKDVNFINAPSHVLVFDKCNGVLVDGIMIKNDLRSPNTDGIDITLTKNVRIANCNIETGDDAICLKSKIDMQNVLGDRNLTSQDVENVVVSNCVLASDDAAFKLGTGSAAVTKNCIFSNCIVKNTRYGLAMFMIDGGLYENILFDNIVIENMSQYKTEYPIFMDIDRRKADSPMGKINGIRFSNMIIETRGNIMITGQKNAIIENVSLENITLKIKNAVDLSSVKKPKGNKTIPYWADSQDFAKENAHITVANAKGITFKNFKIIDDKKGFQRQTIFTENVSDLIKEGF